MHDILSVNQVAGLFNLVQQCPDIVVPIVQDIVRELALREYHYSLHAVDLRRQSLAHHHVSDLCLCSVHTHSHQLGKSPETDALVILLYHSDVVLNELFNEFSSMNVAILSLSSERFISLDLFGNLFHIERHDFEGEEFLEESRN